MAALLPAWHVAMSHTQPDAGGRALWQGYRLGAAQQFSVGHLPLPASVGSTSAPPYPSAGMPLPRSLPCASSYSSSSPSNPNISGYPQFLPLPTSTLAPFSLGLEGEPSLRSKSGQRASATTRLLTPWGMGNTASASEWWQTHPRETGQDKELSAIHFPSMSTSHQPMS